MDALIRMPDGRQSWRMTSMSFGEPARSRAPGKCSGGGQEAGHMALRTRP
jgi:hypothetical protein